MSLLLYHFSSRQMDGVDPYNWDASLNLSNDSEALYNDPSVDDNSSNSLDNDDSGGTDSTDDDLEEELLGDITVEDLVLVMNGSSVESHQARLAIALMILIIADAEDDDIITLHLLGQ